MVLGGATAAGMAGMAGCSSFAGSDGGTPEDGASEELLVASNDESEVVLLRYDHVRDVDEVREQGGQTWVVPVELTAEGRDSIDAGLERLDAAENPEAVEVYTYLDGETVFTAGMTAEAAERSGSDGDDDTGYYMGVPDRETGEELKRRLEEAA